MTAYTWSTGTSGNWTIGGDWTPTGFPQATTDTATISAAGTYTVSLDAKETIGGLTLSSSGATLALGTQTLNIFGDGNVTAGTITMAGGALSATLALNIDAGGSLVGFGSISGSVRGAGVYEGSGGNLRFLENVDGVGGASTGFEIGTGSGDGLQFDGTVAAGTTITFLGNGGLLNLSDVSGNVLQGFNATVAGLAAGNDPTTPTNGIFLSGLTTSNINSGSLNTSTDVLTLITNGGSIDIQLSGSYAAGTMVDFVSNSRNTGSEVFLSIACFANGTLIRTEHGQTAVEDLREGDLVMTNDGGLHPIEWIGHREVNCSRHPAPETVWPVRVQAGAFDDDLPSRDLFLSPDHAVYIGGVLIPVKFLINGSAITQERRESVTYYHVELASHDVILAENLPVESYLDASDRGNFNEHGEVIALFPDFATRLTHAADLIWETRGAAPLVMTGPIVSTVRQVLLDRSRQLAAENDRAGTQRTTTP
jgi:hypothetical protein